MITASIQIDKLSTGSVVMLSLFGSLILTGCSEEAEVPTSTSVAAIATGVLETSLGRFEFTPTTCGIYRQDGIDDIEIQGPGTAPDGDRFFFELSSTANAMTLGLGVDGPFASAERQIKAGQFVSREFTILTTGRQLSVTDLALVDENGTSIDDSATLSIDCGA